MKQSSESSTCCYQQSDSLCLIESHMDKMPKNILPIRKFSLFLKKNNEIIKNGSLFNKKNKNKQTKNGFTQACVQGLQGYPKKQI